MTNQDRETSAILAIVAERDALRTELEILRNQLDKARMAQEIWAAWVQFNKSDATETPGEKNA
jgi:hypothetical protein